MKNSNESSEVQEGLNDPAIFKAIFMAGGPGSGKSFIVKSLALSAMGFKTINSDDAFEYLMQKRGLDFKMPDSELVPRDAARTKAKELTGKKKQLAIAGRLGLVIDGTGDDYAKIAKMKKALEDAGYETAMVFVNTTDKISRERNEKRKRSVPEGVRSSIWKNVQKNLGKFQRTFGARFFIVDNNTIPPVGVNTVSSKLRSWATKETVNQAANAWKREQRKALGLKESVFGKIKKVLR